MSPATHLTRHIGRAATVAVVGSLTVALAACGGLITGARPDDVASQNTSNT